VVGWRGGIRGKRFAMMDPWASTRRGRYYPTLLGVWDVCATWWSCKLDSQTISNGGKSRGASCSDTDHRTELGGFYPNR